MLYLIHKSRLRKNSPQTDFIYIWNLTITTKSSHGHTQRGAELFVVVEMDEFFNQTEWLDTI